MVNEVLLCQVLGIQGQVQSGHDCALVKLHSPVRAERWKKTHAVNIYIVPSMPSVGRETKGCLLETDVGWLALECAVRKP